MRPKQLNLKRMALMAKDRWNSEWISYEAREQELLKKQRIFKDYKQNVYYMNKVGNS